MGSTFDCAIAAEIAATVKLFDVCPGVTQSPSAIPDVQHGNEMPSETFTLAPCFAWSPGQSTWNVKFTFVAPPGTTHLSGGLVS